MKDSINIQSSSDLEKKLHRSARLLSWSGKRRCLTTPSWTVTSYRMYLLQPVKMTTCVNNNWLMLIFHARCRYCRVSKHCRELRALSPPWKTIHTGLITSCTTVRLLTEGMPHSLTPNLSN